MADKFPESLHFVGIGGIGMSGLAQLARSLGWRVTGSDRALDKPENAQIFQAEKDGKVIAASILLHCNGRMNYHLSGSLREYRPLAPTNLLLYEAARWGCENGCRTLYLGGGVGSGEDSLFRFKRAFSRGELNNFFIGKKICDPEKYDMLTALRSGIRNEGYFPKYRG